MDNKDQDPDSDDIEAAMEACPFDEPLHLHHDGCPVCSVRETVKFLSFKKKGHK